MKDFIEMLKKHGYEQAGTGMDDSPPRHDLRMLHPDNITDWWAFRIGGTVVTICDHENEQPHLMCACLEEIERLGWWYSLANNKSAVGGPRYEITMSGDTWKDQHLVWGKTKTEACMNALKAVLEAKDA